MKSVKYCSLQPDFPRKASMLVLFTFARETAFPLPLELVSASLEELTAYARRGIRTVRNQYDQVKIQNIDILIPLVLSAKIPLKRQYWANPSVEFPYWDRVKAFLNLIDKPQLHQLLVTPRFYDARNKKWKFEAALPMLRNAGMPVVESFMLYSKQPVDMRAKSAAIYLPGVPVRFDWRKQKILPWYHRQKTEIQN
jgi:hypothetical protein